MKKSQNALILLGTLVGCMLLSNQLRAQDFQGVATYRSDRDMSDFEFAVENMPHDAVDKIKAQLKKQFQRDYELSFTLTESNWKEKESLDDGPATASTGAMTMTVSIGGGLTYKNTAEKLLLFQTESFSKLFLISDNLEEQKWKMTGATKRIGDYTAYEAVFEDVRETSTLSLADEEQKTETISETTVTRAWYTPEIPVPHGPDEAWGLPGLILELNDGSVSYFCTKVVLNPEKPVEIVVPKKGKKVTEEEFEKISAEMAQSMMNKYSGGEEDGRAIMIRTGN